LGIDESFVRKDSGYYRYRKLKNSTLEDEVENPENFQINDFTYYLYLIHEDKIDDVNSIALWLGKSLVPMECSENKILADKKSIGNIKRNSGITQLSNGLLGININLEDLNSSS